MNDPRAAESSLCGLARSARDGDRAALAAMLRELQDTLWRFCLSQLADRDAADEAVQETATRLITAVRSYRGQSKAKTWALGVALNVCRERRRAPGLAGLTLADPADPQPGAADRVIASEQGAELRGLVARLPERQREAVVLRYFEGLSVDETAAAMGCAAGTVKATLWQALRRLRHSLKTEVEETCG